MPLPPGTRIGVYQVTGPIGQGGMGEVYRATDTTLGRSVAIKVLPDSFAFDRDRLARFEREARTLASLNHPNIAQVYGYETANGIRALVMELVEGLTLADRIAEGPVPLDEALPIARQIATALEVAHDAGIVHRDLKPANVKVRPDGTVKVLDFGLAKAVEPAGVSGTDAMSPTITSPALMTGAGMLLGTAGYMSPEQARGKAVDRRADIWAFGVVLYEMLTGTRLFDGETNIDVLAQVVHKEPDFRPVPAHLRRLLQRCLEKDPKKRLRDITGVELLLEEPLAASPARVRWVPWIAAGVLAITLAVVTWALWPTFAGEQIAPEFTLEAPPDAEFIYAFPGAAVSRDGRLLAFTAERGKVPLLWVRPVDSLDAQALGGTETANFPFWSPDAKTLAFFSTSERTLKRIDLAGGTPQKLCEAPFFEGGDWNRQGVILYSSDGILYRVAATGGTCSTVTRPNPASERHTFPHFLPNGRSFLYVVRSPDSNVAGVYASSLDAPERRTKVVGGNTKALFAPPLAGRPGFLLFLRDRTLVAQRFDADTFALEGDPVMLAEKIRVGGGNQQGVSAFRAAFWVSDNGLLMYRTGPEGGRTLAWFGRDQKRLDTVLVEERDAELVNNMQLSPDRTRLAVERTINEVSDLWVRTLDRGVWNKLTSTPEREGAPRWSHDGRQIAFSAERSGKSQIYRIDANGGGREERLTDGPHDKLLLDWSQDGKYLIYSELRGKQRDLWILPFETPNGRPGTPISFRTTDYDETNARFSPDGRWIAYTSNVTGTVEAYLSGFPGGPPDVWPLSSGGALSLAWRRDGSELFYRQPNPSGATTLISVPITLGPSVPEIGASHTLFSGMFVGETSVVSDDGQRFLLLARSAESPRGENNPLTVRLNWQGRLK